MELVPVAPFHPDNKVPEVLSSESQAAGTVVAEAEIAAADLNTAAELENSKCKASGKEESLDASDTDSTDASSGIGDVSYEKTASILAEADTAEEGLYAAAEDPNCLSAEAS